MVPLMFEDLAFLADMSGVGLAALMIVAGWRVVVQGYKIVEEKLLPLAQNHLEHMEQAFKDLRDSHDRLNQTQERIIKKLDES